MSMQFFQSSDGKKFAGFKFSEPKAVVAEEVVTAGKVTTDNKVVNEMLAQIAENCSSGYAEKASHYFQRANHAAEKISALIEKGQRIKKKIRFWKGATLPCTLVHGVIGLILGIMLGISQVLRFHGPTVTFLGTIGAFGIYALSGAFFAAFMGWLGRATALNFALCYKEDLEKIQDLLRHYEEKEEAYILKTEEYAKLAQEEKKKELIYRGFIR